ncbi:hypothetical protein CSKR_100095, partial [Clonorchis sinensis]
MDRMFVAKVKHDKLSKSDPTTGHCSLDSPVSRSEAYIRSHSFSDILLTKFRRISRRLRYHMFHSVSIFHEDVCGLTWAAAHDILPPPPSECRWSQSSLAMRKLPAQDSSNQLILQDYIEHEGRFYCLNLPFIPHSPIKIQEKSSFVVVSPNNSSLDRTTYTSLPQAFERRVRLQNTAQEQLGKVILCHEYPSSKTKTKRASQPCNWDCTIEKLPPCTHSPTKVHHISVANSDNFTHLWRRKTSKPSYIRSHSAPVVSKTGFCDEQNQRGDDSYYIFPQGSVGCDKCRLERVSNCKSSAKSYLYPKRTRKRGLIANPEENVWTIQGQSFDPETLGRAIQESNMERMRKAVLGSDGEPQLEMGITRSTLSHTREIHARVERSSAQRNTFCTKSLSDSLPCSDLFTNPKSRNTFFSRLCRVSCSGRSPPQPSSERSRVRLAVLCMVPFRIFCNPFHERAGNNRFYNVAIYGLLACVPDRITDNFYDILNYPFQLDKGFNVVVRARVHNAQPGIPHKSINYQTSVQLKRTSCADWESICAVNLEELEEGKIWICVKPFQLTSAVGPKMFWCAEQLLRKMADQLPEGEHPLNNTLTAIVHSDSLRSSGGGQPTFTCRLCGTRQIHAGLMSECLVRPFNYRS